MLSLQIEPSSTLGLLGDYTEWLVVKYASYRKYVNAHVLHFRGAILNDPRVKDFRGWINP